MQESRELSPAREWLQKSRAVLAEAQSRQCAALAVQSRGQMWAELAIKKFPKLLSIKVPLENENALL